ncbi:MAG: WecB/TagA/CpsF family glycosyltransferase [Verrucomicrobiaceae bacterium]
MSMDAAKTSLRGKTVDVIGTPCLLTSYEHLFQDFHEWVADASRPTLSVDFTNVHITALRSLDAGFARATASVDAFVPDGAVLTAAANRNGGVAVKEIYGPKFMADFLRDSGSRGTHYLLGASRPVLAQLEARIKELAPKICIVGRHHGYLAEDGRDDAAIVDELNGKIPDFIWVGMGTPLQQAWISRNKPRISHGILMAVGFAFDVISGTKTDAPPWMHRLSLVWLFRLIQEPRRLGPRYLKYNTVFLWKWFRQRMAGTSSPISSS